MTSSVLGPSAVEGPRSQRLVRTLSLTVFLQWLGASAIIPMLPEYIRHRGGSDTLAGLVMAAFFAAGVLFQYPAGRLADRIGRRPVLLAGLVAYGVASVAFLAPIGPVADVGLRALQGVGAGAAEVAALAMVSGAVASERRGRAFASIYGGQIAGMAVGPLIGSIMGVNLMWVVFLGAGVASVAACVPAYLTTEHRRAVHSAIPGGAPRPRGAARGRVHLNRALVGSLLAAATLGLTTGVYEICWTLLLHKRGATDWEIGLSWTLFAVPFVLMAGPSGWLADHVDRRRLVLGGLVLSVALCATYPFLPDVPLLVALGGLEAMGFAIALPAVQSLLTQASIASEFGRVQGMFSTSQTAATALSAAAGGALFSLAAWAPFVTVAVMGALLIAAIAIVWASVRGRVRQPLDAGSAPSHDRSIAFR